MRGGGPAVARAGEDGEPDEVGEDDLPGFTLLYTPLESFGRDQPLRSMGNLGSQCALTPRRSP